MPALTAAIAISIHNALLSLRRRRKQKARMPNGRNASTVLPVDIRICAVLKPSGSVAGVQTERILAVLDPAAAHVVVAAGAKHTTGGVIEQLT